MRYLTIEYIKMHSRIDYDCENELLDLYGSAAEDTVLNILNRSLEDLKESNGGEVPHAVIQATLILTASSFINRTPSDPMNKSLVPYNIDLILKPYSIL